MFRLSIPVLALALLCAGCASDPVQRGWVGGRFTDVGPGEPALLGPVADLSHAPHRVRGLPGSAEAERGLLVLEVPGSTPLGAAGLRPGDLIVGVGDGPVDGPAAFERRVRGLAPGDVLDLRVWRDDAVETVSVAVGTETVQPGGLFRIGLMLHGAVDLWPFDGDFDVLGLVRFRTRSPRTDLHGVQAGYALARGAAAEELGPVRTTFELAIVPLGVARTERVVAQEN